MKKRHKLGFLAYTLAGIMAFVGCKASIEEIIRKYNTTTKTPTTSASQADDFDEERYDEIIEDIISTIPSTEVETTQPTETAPPRNQCIN